MRQFAKRVRIAAAIGEARRKADALRRVPITMRRVDPGDILGIRRLARSVRRADELLHRGRTSARGEPVNSASPGIANDALKALTLALHTARSDGEDAGVRALVEALFALDTLGLEIHAGSVTSPVRAPRSKRRRRAVSIRVHSIDGGHWNDGSDQESTPAPDTIDFSALFDEERYVRDRMAELDDEDDEDAGETAPTR